MDFHNTLVKDKEPNSRRRLISSFLVFIISLIGLGVFIYWWLFIPNGNNFPDLYEVDLEESSQEDYLEDFDYVYNHLKENYPYFEVNQLKTGLNWLDNYDLYRQRIMESENDEQFYQTMQDILSDLNNGHTHLIPEDMGINMYILYKTNYPRGNWRYKIGETYEKDQARARYNINNESIGIFLEDLEKDKNIFESNNSNIHEENVFCKDIVDDRLAYIKIKSLVPDPSDDAEIIKPYLNKIKDYQALIIDISGNGGGSDSYFTNFLYPLIIGKEYSTVNYGFIRSNTFDSVLWQSGYKELNNEIIDEFNFPKETKEIISNFAYYSSNEWVIRPEDDSIKFQGNIYLLVDGKVYSSSESMASFTKETGLGTLVGSRTGGDGIGIDPMQVALPNTGYVLRYSLDMGVTKSGVINELYQTEPDIYCDLMTSSDILYEPCIKKNMEIEKIEK